MVNIARGFDIRIADSYVEIMRSHTDIVIAAGNDFAVAAMIGPDVKHFNVRDWRLWNYIPAERWKRFVDLRLATYEELAVHAQVRPSRSDVRRQRQAV